MRSTNNCVQLHRDPLSIYTVVDHNLAACQGYDGNILWTTFEFLKKEPRNVEPGKFRVVWRTRTHRKRVNVLHDFIRWFAPVITMVGLSAGLDQYQWLLTLNWEIQDGGNALWFKASGWWCQVSAALKEASISNRRRKPQFLIHQIELLAE